MKSPLCRPILESIFILSAIPFLFFASAFPLQPAGHCIQERIDDTGDLNLNGISYEIADIVLYENYFIYGSGVLLFDPGRRRQQILASDVNRDEIGLRISDLIQLWRVLVGEEDPHPLTKPSVALSSDTAQFQILQTVDSLVVSSNSPVDVRGVFLRLVFTGTMGEPVKLDSASGLSLGYQSSATEISLFLSPIGMDPLSDIGRIPAGNWPILSIPFTGTLEHAEGQASTFDGQELAAVIPGAPTSCADLIVESFTLSGQLSASPGDSIGFRLNATIKNTGNLTAGDSFFVGFFISSDSSIALVDQLLVGGQVAVANLPAGDSVNISIPPAMSIPIDYWPTGNAYLGIIAENLAHINECDEFNNWAFIPISIEPPPVSVTDSLKVNSVAIYAGQTTVSIPIYLANSTVVAGVRGRVAFDSNLVSPAGEPFERAGRPGLHFSHPTCSEPGAIVFNISANDESDMLAPGSGNIGYVNLNVLNTQDTVICIRLEDDPQPLGYRNQLYSYQLIFPSLKPGNLLIGAGSAASACPETAFKLGDLNLDGVLAPADVVLLLNCLFLTGTWDCPLYLTDANCDGSLTTADVVAIINAAFLGETLGCP